MIRTTIWIICLSLIWTIGFSQEQIAWSENETITQDSFKGDVPPMAEDNVQQYFFSSTFDFSYQMMAVQFAFTKNFNQYVRTYYVPSLSWMEEGTFTEQLLLMANLDFDLAELYARKFRKRMYESKNVGSDFNFYNKLFEETNREYMNRQAIIQSEIRSRDDMEAYLEQEIQTVNAEIAELHEFCQKCKPTKKKKKRKKKH